MPREAAEIFAAARPLYDFTSDALKPWHMKVSYQLYNEKDEPTSKGTYEYWWASPGTYRSTWKRVELEHTDWYVGGTHYSSSTGEALPFLERKMQSNLIRPLPTSDELRSDKTYIQREVETLGTAKLPCLMVVPKMQQHGKLLDIPMGLFPTYCFDADHPRLRTYHAFGSTSVLYNNITRVEGILLPRRLDIFEGKRRTLSATVDVIEGFPAKSATFTPDAGAESIPVDAVEAKSKVTPGKLLKMSRVEYPQDAKNVPLGGKVVLSVLIGTDGHVHDLRVVEAPWPSLVAAAISAASTSVYTPFLLNGKPIEVERTITVVYGLN